MIKTRTENEKQTMALAQAFAASLKGGEILALEGDLGAGKTVFARGLAKALGIKQKINSPTFVIMKVYKGQLEKKKINFCHIDAYRLQTAKDLEAIGALDYFSDPKSLVLIEWAEKIKKIIPKTAIKIKLKHLPKGRIINID